MKYIFILITVFWSTGAFANSYKIGILYTNAYVTEKEAIVASKIWNSFVHEKDYKVNIETILYNSTKKMLEDYKNGKIFQIILDPIVYLKNRKLIDKYSEDRWELTRSKSKLRTFYLIKNKDLKFDLKDLKDKYIIYKGELSKAWLEYENLKLNGKQKLKFKKIRAEKRLVFDVFFDKNNLAIISKVLYDNIIKLNPQVSNNILIIKKSQKIFPQILGFDRVGLDKKFSFLVKKLHEDMKVENRYMKSLNYANLNKIFYLEDEYFKKFISFYEEFEKEKNP